MTSPANAISRPAHRIGGVSSLSGVPVSTLRIWEVRYSAFNPSKTQGQHRLYTDEDVLKATLLRQLTEKGHAISSIANQHTSALNQLLQQQKTAQNNAAGHTARGETVTAAVVGLSLARRIASPKFNVKGLHSAIRVNTLFPDLASALSGGLQDNTQLLLVHVNSLHTLVQVEIQRLADQNGILQVIVLYNFGQQWVVDSMKRPGMVVRREPIADSELADLISAVLLTDAQASSADAPGSGMIPARKYNDETLARVASIDSKVLCECPRHVAEIITLLVSFEQYSNECLNKSAEDAHLHAYLSSVSGSARAMFEKALEKIAQHEGIALN